MALQAILAEVAGNRFSPEDQEYLVSTRFIAQVYTSSLQTHLRPLERAGIVQRIKAANTFSTTLGNHNLPQTSPPQPRTLNQPRGSPSRYPRPTQAVQGKYETVRMYSLNSGNCPVIKASIGARTRKFLADKGAAISIVKPETIPLRRRNQIDQKQAVVMEAMNGSAFKSEGSINLQFRLGNQCFNIVYIFSIINGDGLLGVDFLGKHRVRILIDKDKLVLDGTVELTLGRERPCLVSQQIKTQESTRAERLLKGIEGIPNEVKSFLKTFLPWKGNRLAFQVL